MFLIKLCMFLTFVSFYFPLYFTLSFLVRSFYGVRCSNGRQHGCVVLTLFRSNKNIFFLYSSSYKQQIQLLTISRAKIIILDNVEYSDTTIRDIFHDVDPSNCLRTQKMSTYPNIFLYGCTLGAVDFSRFKKQRFGMISI